MQNKYDITKIAMLHILSHVHCYAKNLHSETIISVADHFNKSIRNTNEDDYDKFNKLIKELLYFMLPLLSASNSCSKCKKQSLYIF